MIGNKSLCDPLGNSKGQVQFARQRDDTTLLVVLGIQVRHSIGHKAHDGGVGGQCQQHIPPQQIVGIILVYSLF